MEQRGTASLAGGGGIRSREFVERMLEVQPRLQRALDVTLPPEISSQLGSVTVHQLEALGCLPPEGTPMRAFARAVGISGAAATALANRMVAKGLATRRYDPEDRRTVWLAPTEMAIELVRSFREWQRKSMAVTLERLDEKQIVTFLEVLGVLSASEPEGAR
ncbi:MAG TPA: MarR family transcriptional regulator [Candidatus Dormibacteraeota bacterium]